MTTPHKPKPSCEHVQNVTVADGTQVNLDGHVYGPGQQVTDVPAETAELWISNGWAEETRTKTAPAKAAGRE